MSWARWKRDIAACFLSATACTCLPASTLRRPAPGSRWPAASGPRDADGTVSFAPRLPGGLTGLALSLMIQRLRVEVTHAEASYALADGGSLEIVHHGQPVSLTARKPQARPIPAAPSRPRPSQPPGREPAHRPPTANPGHQALALTRPRTPAGSQREPRRTVRLTEHRARRKSRGRGLAARPFRPWAQIGPFGPGRTAMPPAGLPRRSIRRFRSGVRPPREISVRSRSRASG
jgi:hypothetical protein